MKSYFNTVSISKYEIGVLTGSREGAYPLISLHGFTGSSLEWEPFLDEFSPKCKTFAIDLPGHGRSSSPEEHEYYTPSALTNMLDDLLANLELEEVILCGYSMGGRLALTYALQHPAKVKGLILESTTAGIEDGEERETRYNEDTLLAGSIAAKGMNWFVDHWMSKPLFQTLKYLPQEKYDKLLSLKKKNDPAGLSNILHGFSTGAMPSYWEKLSGLDIPALLITGELDYKFTAINKQMSELLSNSGHKIIMGTGHNTHLEKPEEFINLVNSYLRTYF